MPEINSEEYTPFYAMPFIKGVKPWQAGVEQTQGSTVIDGVLYLLLGCDNLEIFADMGVYLAISDRPFYSHDTYRWFLGYGMTEKIPHFTTFGKNYERRFADSDVFEKIFEHIIDTRTQEFIHGADSFFTGGCI